jgi:2-keto-4-pentenoate hydratase
MRPESAEIGASKTEVADRGLTQVGRPIHGPTPPGGGIPCARTTPLSESELEETVQLLLAGHRESTPVDLPERLRTRDWDSMTEVMLRLDRARGLVGVGWKIGAASEEIRRVEQIPQPVPGRIYSGTVFSSPARLPRSLFINYRNNETEFAFRIGVGLLPRPRPYHEDEVGEAVECVLPAIEIGDMVFRDWYAASGYLGPCIDNGGGAALVHGEPIVDWRVHDLSSARVDLHLNNTLLKSGFGRAAMGNPLTSLTWVVNWLRERNRGVAAGEIISTGTCTGHCFVAVGDDVSADFGPLGTVAVTYVE